MGVTLEQLLTLAGRLDDGPGFDATRERFRRFLGEYVNDAETSRALIEEAQNTPGEQHQRALQDLVVNLGRVLQFEVVFGTSNATNGTAPYQGLWLSARSVVVLDVRSSRSASGVVDGLVRAVTTAKETVPTGTAVVGVTALAPLALSRRKVDDAIAASSADVQLHAIPIAALLSLADLIASEHVTHADVVRLLAGNAPVDFVVGLVDRAVEKATPPSVVAASPAAGPVDSDGRVVPMPIGSPRASEGRGADGPADASRAGKIWLVSVAPEHATPPDVLLETVVARRQMFGISLNSAPVGPVRVGDILCFYIDFKGVVGSALVDGLVEGGGGLREARLLRQVLHLDRVEIDMRAPTRLDAETDLRLHAIPQVLGRRGQTLLELSAEAFARLKRQGAQRSALTTDAPESLSTDPAGSDTRLTG